MIRKLIGLLRPSSDPQVGTPTALCALVGVAAGTYLLAQYARQQQQTLILATTALYRLRRELDAVQAETQELEDQADDDAPYPAPEDIDPLGAGETEAEPRFMADQR